jgi:hypothetical protein
MGVAQLLNNDRKVLLYMNIDFSETQINKEENFGMLLSCHQTNSTNFSYLVRLMQRNVVIPFLGAGLTMNFGYPGWGNFIRKQSDEQNVPEARQALKEKKYEKAASLLKQKITGNAWENILLQTFGDHVYKISDSNNELELIPKIFRSLILTTNFDEVIEMLYAKVNGEYIEKLTPKSLKDVKIIYKRIACGDPTLIKLHGDVATREFILTEQEYNETYGERILDIRLPLPAFLRDILLSKIILFMGCSLEDDRTLRVLEQAQIDGSLSFALLPLPIETENKEKPWEPNLFDIVDGVKVEKEVLTQRKRFLNEHNIIPIWYPYGRWASLKIFLSELAIQISSEFKMSVTNTRKKLNYLLDEGREQEKCGNILQVVYLFMEAEKLIKVNSWMFAREEQINYLQTIKKFYSLNGYAYERKKILKDLIVLIGQSKYYNSTELAICYHDIGYIFERYRYYRLMLKAMIRSSEILEKSKGYLEKDEWDVWFDNAAYIYTSLAYAYLKNSYNEKAKYWYQKAMELNKNDNLSIRSQAFINNGLSRYYSLLGNTEKALDCLDTALKQRRTLEYKEDQTLPQHIINTHSNKIRIYLSEKKDLNMAEAEYNSCMQEDDIWNKLRTFPDAKRRILTDHGDILNAMGKYSEAFDEYKKALLNRKYLHFIDDFTVGELYLKMSKSLKEIPDRLEESLEYMIQAYVILEKLLGGNHNDVKTAKEQMQNLSEKLCYKKKALQQRLEVQRNFLNYRYDERMEGREDELIQFFEL